MRVADDGQRELSGIGRRLEAAGDRGCRLECASNVQRPWRRLVGVGRWHVMRHEGVGRRDRELRAEPAELLRIPGVVGQEDELGRPGRAVGLPPASFTTGPPAKGFYWKDLRWYILPCIPCAELARPTAVASWREIHRGVTGRPRLSAQTKNVCERLSRRTDSAHGDKSEGSSSTRSTKGQPTLPEVNHVARSVGCCGVNILRLDDGVLQRRRCSGPWGGPWRHRRAVECGRGDHPGEHRAI